jgi:hypothetical protein
MKAKRVDRSPEETELLRQLEGHLRARSLVLRTLIACNLRLASRERKIPLTETKLEMARRLAFFYDKQKG